MVSYLITVKDTESKICSPRNFKELTESPMVRQLVEDYRKGNPAAKHLLPTFMFQGYDPNVLLGKTGSRLAKNLVPTGLYMMDFDHVEEPVKLYQDFVIKCSELFATDEVALAHVTPSGKGLRLVIKLPEGKTIEEAQADMEQKLQVKADGVVKDLSRQSFCPMASDILYIDEQLLFKTPDITNDTRRKEDSKEECSGTDAGIGLHQRTDKATDGLADDSGHNRKDVFPAYFRGIAYTRIVDELINVLGGTPELGNRENTLFRLASDMAKITDRSVPWLESLLPTFGLPEDEWRATIKQVCKKPLETSFSRNLNEALQRCKYDDADGDGRITPDEYKDNFPENAPALVKLLTSRCMPHMKTALAHCCFPALAAHVSQHKFLMNDKSKQELGIMTILVASSSSGKSCIDEPIRLICKDIEALDKVNRERREQYREQQRNRKANERGMEKPKDLIIRCIGGNCSYSALLELLTAAEDGDKEHPCQTLYSKVEEIQYLYKMASDQSGRTGVGLLIKSAYDRAPLDSNKSGANSVCAYTPARWNFTASTTPRGALNFFKGILLTDGTVSRVAFVMMPNVDIPTNEFYLGNYDASFERELSVFISNLNNYKHPVDADGQAIPKYLPQAIALRKKIGDIIDIEKCLEEDRETYLQYAYRTRDIIIREAITCYIANGCVWEDCDDYWLWCYSELMGTKLDLFGKRAKDNNDADRINRKGGRKSALSFMPKEFTYQEFEKFCQENPSICKDPRRKIERYKYDGLIKQIGDKYQILDEVEKLLKR